MWEAKASPHDWNQQMSLEIAADLISTTRKTDQQWE